MKNWIKKSHKHLIIWTVLLVYFFTANQIYVLFFLKNGKPSGAGQVLPSAAQGISYKFSDLMQPISVDGQALFEIKGYAFDPSDPVKYDTIKIVLTTGKQAYTFATRPVDIPNLIESVKAYAPGMARDEFSFLLSNQALKPGSYVIGILLQDSKGTDQTYVLTGGKIWKTPNTLKYQPG